MCWVHTLLDLLLLLQNLQVSMKQSLGEHVQVVGLWLAVVQIGKLLTQQTTTGKAGNHQADAWYGLPSGHVGRAEPNRAGRCSAGSGYFLKLLSVKQSYLCSKDMGEPEAVTLAGI